MQRLGRLVSSCDSITEVWKMWCNLLSIGDTANPGRLIVSETDRIAIRDMRGILPLPELTVFIFVSALS